MPTREPTLQPPRELGGATVLEYAVMAEGLRPTGATEHRVSDEVIGPAAGLAICRYESDSSGVYLFYCDAAWNVRTDTWHATVDDAKAQAEYEYEGVSKHWSSAA